MYHALIVKKKTGGLVITATSDFLEDAADMLQADPDSLYVLLAAHPGGDSCYRVTCVRSREQLDWFKTAFDKMYAELSASLT